MRVIDTVRAWARRIKLDGMTLWFACRHPGTPWVVKALVAVVVAYAFSPIDLVPDFIPVLGFVDDMLLLPLLMAAALRMLPAEVRAASRAQADAWMAAAASRPRSVAGAAVIVVLWLGVGGWAVVWVLRALP